ncbi:MAG: MFS transporter, partial [Haliea sp.]
YTPGARGEAPLLALTVAYCLLPCILKLLAATTLYFTLVRDRLEIKP